MRKLPIESHSVALPEHCVYGHRRKMALRRWNELWAAAEIMQKPFSVLLDGS